MKKTSTSEENQRLGALYQALEELGCSELERKLYTVSLNMGPSTIASIAEKLGISRPNMYVVIRGLERKGLATFGGGRTYVKSFQVESPSVLLEKLREKRKQIGIIDEILTAEVADLLAQHEQGKGPLKVRVLKGKKDFVDAYVKVFEEAKGEILYFGSYDQFMKQIGSDLGDKRIARRVERGIHIRAIVLPEPGAMHLQTKDKEANREVRFLKASPSFAGSFYLFANKAIFWQLMTPAAVFIEDQYLVAMWRVMFEEIWENV